VDGRRVSKPSLVIVIVEDQRQQMLIRRYLLNKGLTFHQLRFTPLHQGEGSGEQWVRRSYPGEVEALRRRQAKAQTALIVVIDADAGTVEHRLGQLDESLRRSEHRSFDPNRERIARLIPRRNIETWILCLNGAFVDEETEYKRTPNDWNELIPSAAARLDEWTRPNVELPTQCPLLAERSQRTDSPQFSGLERVRP
jgi:DNA polymerase III psi subunit